MLRGNIGDLSVECNAVWRLQPIKADRPQTAQDMRCGDWQTLSEKSL